MYIKICILFFKPFLLKMTKLCSAKAQNASEITIKRNNSICARKDNASCDISIIMNAKCEVIPTC